MNFVIFHTGLVFRGTSTVKFLETSTVKFLQRQVLLSFYRGKYSRGIPLEYQGVSGIPLTLGRDPAKSIRVYPGSRYGIPLERDPASFLAGFPLAGARYGRPAKGIPLASIRDPASFLRAPAKVSGIPLAYCKSFTPARNPA